MVSREEWRRWMDEKNKLISAHNQEKADLVNELRALRKSLSPQASALFQELQLGEQQRASLEEQVVRVTMDLEGVEVGLMWVNAALLWFPPTHAPRLSVTARVTGFVVAS